MTFSDVLPGGRSSYCIADLFSYNTLLLKVAQCFPE
jgi:hypothetical protein